MCETVKLQVNYNKVTECWRELWGPQFVIFTEYCYGGEIDEGEMGVVLTCTSRIRSAQKFSTETEKKR